MTIFQMLSLTNKCHAFIFLISLLPLIPLITLSYSIISLVGSAYLLFLSSSSPHTYHLANRPLPFHLICLPHPLSSVMSHKALSTDPFFSIYTTPFTSLISSSANSHQLYANDTQLFIYFLPKNCSLPISDLQSTISLISSWMKLPHSKSIQN